MVHAMKKSTKVRLASFSAAFLLVLGGLLLDTRLLLNSSKTELEYTYRRALNDLSDYVSGLSLIHISDQWASPAK